MSSASAPGRSTAAATGTPAPARLLAVPLMTTSNAAPASASGRTASATPCRAASAAWRSASASALSSVRLTSTSSAGAASIRGPSTPAAAPPAPISSTRRPASVTPALTVMSRTSPAPSVLSHHQPPSASASKRSVLAASASCARGVRRAASCQASNLNGTVTLQPHPPAAANARTVPVKSSSGASRRSYCSAWPVCVAKRAWMAGERLWATGWPITT